VNHIHADKELAMTIAEERRTGRPESLAGIRIIDVDTHLTERADLWVSKAPAKYKDLVPRVVPVTKDPLQALNGNRLTAGDYAWVVADDVVLGQAGGGSVINKDNVKVKGAGFRHWALTDISPAASFVEPRLEIMDELGVWAQIMYPNVVGFSGQAFAAIEDLELRNTCCSIWNDTMIELYEQSGGRLNGMALVPWWDIERSVVEVERVHRAGLKGVNTSADPQLIGLPDLACGHWDPLWDVCEELNLPVNFHIGASQTQASWFGSAPWPSFDDDKKLAIGSSMIMLGNARVVGNLILGGVLDRHPTLKFVSVESGIGWIPFLLESLEYQASENNVELSMTPTEYFHRQMYACFWFESKGLLEDISRVGFDRCMFETDFPHPTCLYPNPVDRIATVLEDVDFETKKNLLSGNAAKVYNMTVPQD
jgi:predicted TIM-barrel fold metal-dependent hydrolase